MRGGVLLAEQSPLLLMEEHSCTSLEEAFLKLSAKQQNLMDKQGTKKEPYPSGAKPPRTLQLNDRLDKNRLIAQLKKNYSTTMRNLPIMLFVIFLPSINLIFLNLLFWSDFEFSMGVINHEIESCSNISSYEPTDCLPEIPLSCLFVEYLEKSLSLKVVFFHDTVTVNKALKQLKVSAFIEFPNQFSYYIIERLEEQGEASDEAAEGSTALVQLGANDFIAQNELKSRIFKGIKYVLEDVCESCKYPPQMARFPVMFEKYIYGTLGDLKGQVICGYFTAFMFYTNFMLTSSTIVIEKSSGEFERNRISGLTAIEILLAQFIFQVIVMNIQNILSFVVLYGIFSSTMVGSIGLSYSIIIACEVFGMVYGIFIALIISKDQLVSYTGIGTVLTITMMNGTMWAVEGMHWLIRDSGNLLRYFLGVQPYWNVSLRGWPLTSGSVMGGFLCLAAISVAFSLISYLSVRFKIASF